MIYRNCNWCGKEFGTYPYRIKRGEGKFCCATCRNQYGRSLQDQSGENNPAWRGGRDQAAHTANWARKNPEKRKAHHAVESAIKSGALTRRSCERCGASADIHAHHHDYSKPLDVEWLCRQCHTAEHAA